MTEPRIAFKAGRCFRRGTSNLVDASPTKGAILLQNDDEGLLHFMWKNRVTNEVEEVRFSHIYFSYFKLNFFSWNFCQDLLLIPTDATFLKVNQSAWGRTYVLKFSSSNQRHFVRSHFDSTSGFCALNLCSSGCR